MIDCLLDELMEVKLQGEGGRRDGMGEGVNKSTATHQLKLKSMFVLLISLALYLFAKLDKTERLFVHRLTLLGFCIALLMAGL